MADSKKPAEKQPWFKFYTRDWMSDEALNSCSLAAQGAWMRMLCLMHRAEPYGHLTINGKRPADEKLAPALGVPVELLRGLLVELREAGVSSVSNGGVIYSRRMVREAAISEKRTKAVKKRWDKSAASRELEESSARVGGEFEESSARVDFLQESENPSEFGVCIYKTDTQKPEARNQRPEREEPPPLEATAAREVQLGPSPPSESEASVAGGGGRMAENPEIALGLKVAEALGADPDKLWRWQRAGMEVPNWRRSGFTDAQILAFAAAEGRKRKGRLDPPSGPEWLTVAIMKAAKSPAAVAEIQTASRPKPSLEERAAVARRLAESQASEAAERARRHSEALARIAAQQAASGAPH